MTTPADLVRQDTPDDDALARRAAVQHFLRTGGYDPKFPAWSGNVIERETKATANMLQALVAEVKKLSGKTHPASFPADLGGVHAQEGRAHGAWSFPAVWATIYHTKPISRWHRYIDNNTPFVRQAISQRAASAWPWESRREERER